MGAGAIRSYVDSGRWQRLHRGIYATHSGPITRRQRIAGVLLAAGKDATLSYTTAAELVSLVDTVTPAIHVSLPINRRIAPINGAVIHYSSRLDSARHPTKRPPQTRIEETVLDLVDVSLRAEDVIGWLTAACERRLTTPPRLRIALEARSRVHWRSVAYAALDDTDLGVRSPLEVIYLRRVERAHRLPYGERQAPHQRLGGKIYDDIWYAQFKTVVELDGRVAHPSGMAFRDLKRDNIAGARGDVVLHYGWTDVTRSPCAVAAQVGAALMRAGWSGVLRHCGPDCGLA
jgi:very-short-patch-repair endonuclease